MRGAAVAAVAALCACPRRCAAAALRSGTVYYDGGAYRFAPGVVDPGGGAAWGTFDDGIATTGWAELRVNGSVPVAAAAGAAVVHHAAGLLEGALTAARIAEFYSNLFTSYFNIEHHDSLPQVRAWMDAQRAWARGAGAAAPGAAGAAGAVWRELRLSVAAFDGMVEGYTRHAPPGAALSESELYVLASWGDVLDLVWKFWTPPLPRVVGPSRCSAIVKAAPSGELLVGHTSWFTYSAMTRIYKHVALPTAGDRPRLRRVSYSSYPGVLSSNDDWFVNDAGLVVLETSLAIYNHSLWDAATPHALLAWQRARAATRLAASGAEWADAFRRNASGTYNCQWMVVDMKRWRAGAGAGEAPRGTLTVLEQMPGLVVDEDRSAALSGAGYWPSYNVPSFPAIYAASGFAAQRAKEGDAFDWRRAPRARIFARNQSAARDAAGLRALLRYNDWRDDPLSGGDAINAIAARYDLNSPPHRRACEGAYDAKATSSRDYPAVDAVSGPTRAQQPTFEWAGDWANASGCAHAGQPARWDFAWRRFAA